MRKYRITERIIMQSTPYQVTPQLCETNSVPFQTATHTLLKDKKRGQNL